MRTCGRKDCRGAGDYKKTSANNEGQLMLDERVEEKTYDMLGGEEKRSLKVARYSLQE